MPAETPIETDRWHHCIPIAGILVVTVALRLWKLNRWSLWYDEVVTMRLARSTSWTAMMDQLGKIDATRAPLHPALLRVWLDLFGESDRAARAFSASLGILLVVAVYATGRRAFGETTARWAAWLSAVCPTLIYYSQEVRMYALLVLLSVLSWMIFLEFRCSARRELLVLYAALLIALVYTHPLGLFMLAAHVAAFLAVGRLTLLTFRRWILVMALTTSGVAPWVPRFLDHAPESTLPRQSIRFLLAIPIEFVGGNSLTLLPFGGLIVLGLVTRTGRRLKLREPFEGPALACWLVVPPVLMYAYSFFGHPIFGPARYHLYVAPAYFLLLARGLALLPRWGRLVAGCAMLALTVPTLINPTDIPGKKADWRSLRELDQPA